MQVSHVNDGWYSVNDMEDSGIYTVGGFEKAFGVAYERFGITVNEMGDMVVEMFHPVMVKEIDGKVVCADRTKEGRIRVREGTKYSGCVNGFIFHTVPLVKG